MCLRFFARNRNFQCRGGFCVCIVQYLTRLLAPLNGVTPQLRFLGGVEAKCEFGEGVEWWRLQENALAAARRVSISHVFGQIYFSSWRQSQLGSPKP